jgi:hypothetical protein
MFWSKKPKAEVLTDLFSPTVEFLSQPKPFESVGPGLPDDVPILPAAKRKLGVLYHLNRERGTREMCALTLTGSTLHFSTYNSKKKECTWKKWETIKLSPFCVCGEVEIGDNLLHDAVSERAFERLSKGRSGQLPVS